jgi:LPS export ABC transporter protein LptC
MRTMNLPYSFTMAALLLGCFFVVTFTSCENKMDEVEKFYQKKIAIEEAYKVESYLSQGGKVKAKLTSPYMLRYQADSRSQADSPYIEFPRTMHVDFYDDSTKVESTVDSRYAKYVEFAHKILLRDSVVVMSLKNGDTLRTEELWWDQDKQEFYTDKPAHILQRDKTIFAKNGLRAAQNLTSYTTNNNSGIIGVPENGIPK